MISLEITILTDRGVDTLLKCRGEIGCKCNHLSRLLTRDSFDRSITNAAAGSEMHWPYLER